MSVPFWLRSERFRRTVALSSVVLATGGLILYRTPPSNAGTPSVFAIAANGKNAVAFRGPRAAGTLSLSHTKVLAGRSTPVLAELELVADPSDEAPRRAPLSLAIVLDTSGSMSGEKLADAKRSALRLVEEMHDDDEVAVVRYSDTSEVIQSLARVGSVRRELRSRIEELDTNGGTNIPAELSQGLRSLDDAALGRVRRLVLVSDGLDGTRVQAEALARSSFARGMTVSSLGIGLDFDESYMGAVAQSGHGNFAFVKDGDSLGGFLHRELEQTASTTIEDARVTIALPAGMRFVSASGADAAVKGDRVELKLGALFAGDRRRVILELSADASNEASAMALHTTASWRVVGGSTTETSVPSLTLVASSDAADVERGRDGNVFASATSVLASKRQLEAASAYARGDVVRATALTTENEAALGAAMAAAPAAASALSAQQDAYSAQKRSFRAVAPDSAKGKAAAKSATMKDLENIDRRAF